MSIETTELPGVLVIRRPTHRDDRGFFREPFRLNELEDALGGPIHFVQQNHSRSYRGILRGLHAENWDKLVYVPHGRVFTALADIRPESPAFGRVLTFEWGGDDLYSIYIPRGLAHGYCVLSEEADYVYLVTAYFDGSDTRAVAWDDPDLAISWPIADPIVSDRDRSNPTLSVLIGGRPPDGSSV